MSEPRDKQSDEQARVLREFLEEQASIDLDVLEVGQDRWAIHGVFPYDGEAPLAVFDSYDEARSVLDEVCGIHPVDEL